MEAMRNVGEQSSSSRSLNSFAGLGYNHMEFRVLLN